MRGIDSEQTIVKTNAKHEGQQKNNESREVQTPLCMPLREAIGKSNESADETRCQSLNRKQN